MILEVDTEHGRLSNTQIAGDAGRNIDFLCSSVFALEVDHAQHGRTLCDVGECDHGPQHRAAEVGDQLHINGVGHMVQAGDDQRCIHKAEDGTEHHAEGTGNARVDHIGDDRANLPADGTEHGVCNDNGQHQTAERHHDHGDDCRADLTEEPFQIHQRERREDGRDDLCLIADHVHGEEAEVPFGDICRCSGSHAVGIEQLPGNQRQAQHDAKALGGAHLFGDRPADADRQHMEDGLADQPQKAVHAGPELADIAQGFGAVFKEVDAVDAVAEAKDQTAGDDRRDQRCKDLGQCTHDLLQGGLVLLGRALDGILGHAVNAGHRDEIIVEITHRVADDDLKLARLGESALGGFQCLDLGNVRLGGIVEDKSHTRYAMRHCRNVFFAAHIFEKQLCIFLIFTHDVLLLYFDFSIGCSTCSNKLILQLQYG